MAFDKVPDIRLTGTAWNQQ